MIADNEGVTREADLAIRLGTDAILDEFGDRVACIALFGSRSRGEARPDSDCDLAVVFEGAFERREQRVALSDLTYDAVVGTDIELHVLAVSIEEWLSPGLHPNPSLVSNMRQDGLIIYLSREHYPDLADTFGHRRGPSAAA